ncbi:MAG: aldose 1-epimerase family protein [Nocardioidaceae bacterium]
MIRLGSGRYRAVVNPYGASLAELSCDGRDVVVPQDGRGGPPTFRGAVLAPWPNRVHDGRYEFGGEPYALEINEPARGAALHGLVFDREWAVSGQDADRAALTVAIDPQEGYPFALRLEIEYALGDDGLAVTLRATNVGERAAPYGCGFHPYFSSGPVPIDDVEVRIDAAEHLDVAGDRMLPVGVSDTEGTAYDFTGGRPVGDQRLDDAYTRVGRVRLGHGVDLWRDEGLPWLQAFTPEGRDAIALEPCTCPEDAFRSGRDLVVLEPGEEHRVAWGVTVAPGGRG